MGHDPIEFPKMMYKEKGQSLIVEDGGEEKKARKDGWQKQAVPTKMYKKDMETGRVIEVREVSTPDAVAALLADQDGKRKHPWSFDDVASLQIQ